MVYIKQQDLNELEFTESGNLNAALNTITAQSPSATASSPSTELLDIQGLISIRVRDVAKD